MKSRDNFPIKLTGLSSSSTEKNYDLVNVSFRKSGRAEPRDSYVPIATLTTGVRPSVRSVYRYNNHLFVFYTDSSGGYLRYFDHNNIPQPITGFPDPVTASFMCDFSEFNGLLFVCPNYDANSVVYVISYDSDLKTYSARTTTATTGQDQKLQAGLMIKHRDVMFAARIRDTASGMTLAANRVRWSAFDEPENFDPWGTEGNPSWMNYVDLGENNDPIMRMVSFKNDLFVFKQKSTWLISGFADFGAGLAPEVVREINHELGITGPYAVSWDEEKIVFISEMGIFKFNGQYFTKMDGDIWEYFRDIPRNCLWHACVNNEDDMDRYHILLPRNGQTIDDDFVLCEDGRWSRWEFPAPVTFMKTDVDESQKYYTVLGTSTGVLMGRGEDFNIDVDPEMVQVTWASDWITLGYAGMKQPRSLELLIAARGDFPLTVEVTTEFGTQVVQTTTIKQLESAYPVLDSTAITDSTPVTMDRDNFFPWIIDLMLGSCRRVKFKISGPLLTIHEAKIGYRKGTGI